MEAQSSVMGKLAAILSADTKGYSRLMGEDEEATIRTMSGHREVMFEAVRSHAGRLVDTPGDNLLAEFPSVVEAVQCAIDIQRELRTRNADLPSDRAMEFRIGINLGDVIVEGEKIYGDGINIAARLESLAEPGGVCISGTVYDQVENKRLGYEYLGEQTVKNIARPVRVYRVRLDRSAITHARNGAGVRRRTYLRRAVIGVGVLLIVSVSVILARRVYLRLFSAGPPISSQKPLSLPDKPSLVVLPFVNMSKDPDQEYFSDGLTEVLTGDLSQISSVFVIARDFAFTYKGKAVKVQDVAQEMGVRYVLEGSVLKADNQVRINAQLIDATTGYHLWSERYDRPSQNILTLQDEIVQKIVTTLKLQLTVPEIGDIVRKHTDNVEAYDAFLRGQAYFLRFKK
jgi:adenylate cyclase